MPAFMGAIQCRSGAGVKSIDAEKLRDIEQPTAKQEENVEGCSNRV